MNRQNQSVSVIICAYTEKRLFDVKEAVDSVIKQRLPPLEIIVSVDHNPSLAEKLKKEIPPQVIVIPNNGIQGLSGARNTGIRAAKGEIIVFLDDDAVAEKDWLEKLTFPFSDQMVAAVGGRAIPLWQKGCRPSWFPEELDWIVGCTSRGLTMDGKTANSVPGCNMSFRRHIFDTVGYWGEKIGAKGQSQKDAEEAELCQRIKYYIKNAKISFRPDAIIYHKVPADRTTLRWIIRRSFMQGQSKRVMKYLTKSPNPLTTENSYLNYLLSASIPKRLLRFYKKGSLSQIISIMVCIVSTGAGYFVWMKRH
jgi:O-antigen biosynthesis protein